jgi:hypothetical protein
MSDVELVKRLRDAVNGEHDMTPHGADCLQAADRIEALTDQLAKAVEALRNIAVVGFSSDPSVNAAIAKQTVTQARATLAEIKEAKT